tara:strand:- start:6713 stop:9745 length:3033 start_codon:yes stop_codon:yes gene_type:complete
MAEKKFKFVSPGIFLSEVDNSQNPSAGDAPGPVLIGRFERGPGMRPTIVNSFSEFVEIFGNPISGKGTTDGDVWRNGNYLAPTYAAYAAQAWLRNNPSCTVIRLLGTEDPNASAGGTDGPAGTGGKAGWDMGEVGSSAPDGAYGLFVFPKFDTLSTTAATPHTGTLAAIFYVNHASTTLALTGTARVTSGKVPAMFPTASHGALLVTSSANASGQFTMVVGTQAEIATANSVGAKKIEFNFNENSEKFIRKVFNTNPAKVNSNAYSTTEAYFLGETFERQLLDQQRGGAGQHGGAGAAVNGYGVGEAGTGLSTLNNIGAATMLPLKSVGGGYDWANHKRPMQAGRTGWFVAQHQGAAGTFNAHQLQKLFRLHSLEPGEWTQRNLKVSIQDITPPKSAALGVPQFSTFTVVIRKIDDSDASPQLVERFSGCDLNPNSANYICRKIGDKYVEWDNTKRSYREYGTYNNMSKFISVEVNEVVSNGDAANLMPMGMYGPPRPKKVAIGTGRNIGSESWVLHSTGSFLPTHFEGTMSPAAIATGGGLFQLGLTGALIWPQPILRHSNTEDNLPKKNSAYFGMSTSKSGSGVFAPSTVDVLRALPSGIGTFNSDSSRIVTEGATYVEPSFIFTLDNLSASADGSGDVKYVSGSRLAGTSLTALSGTNAVLTGSSFGHNRFTTLFHGGFDGLDVTEKDPFRNTRLDDSSDAKLNYTLFSTLRAIDTARDPEFVECNLMAMPGITNTSVTDHMIDVCEERADALAIIDLEDDYIPAHESTATEANRKPDVDTAVQKLKNRQINSSYGAAYYPFVQIRDSLANQLLFVPPSVVGLGTLSYSESVRDVWFAPAGFTRGGLSDGKIGFPVVGVKHQLTSEERDKLYEVNVNPIASFPAEGIVVFGQKTLQVTESALNRINVRRLLIFLKREISRVAATTLFEQNVRATWNGFSARVESILNDVKSRLGLADFKVVLDESTTTPDLVDRNIMYAKVFLKPVQAIEFIALDFVITDSGASFAD